MLGFAMTPDELLFLHDIKLFASIDRSEKFEDFLYFTLFVERPHIHI